MEAVETTLSRYCSMQPALTTMTFMVAPAMIMCKEQEVQTTFMVERVMISSKVVTGMMKFGVERATISLEEARLQVEL